MILYKRMSWACLLACLLSSSTIFAQQKGSNNFSKGIQITGKTGTSFLVTEVHKDLTGFSNEFNNLPGPYAGIELTRFFSHALEAGGSVSYSYLRGNTEDPEFAAFEYHHYMKKASPEPMEYNNRLYGPEVFARYHFGRNIHKPKISNFFLKAGAGILFYESELLYSSRQEDKFIFGKGHGEFKTTRLSNIVYLLGGGLNYRASEMFSMKIAANMNMVGYDFLDNVHNYSASGERRDIIGLYSDITAGITIYLGREEKNAISSRGKLAGTSYLPFSPQ